MSQHRCVTYTLFWWGFIDAHGLKIQGEGQWGFCQILGGREYRGCENFGGRVHIFGVLLQFYSNSNYVLQILKLHIVLFKLEMIQTNNKLFYTEKKNYTNNYNTIKLPKRIYTKNKPETLI